MGFLSPDPPPQAQTPIPTEDPAIAAERERLKQRAEDDKVRATQDQLRLETQGTQQNGISGLFNRTLSGPIGRRALTSLLGKG